MNCGLANHIGLGRGGNPMSADGDGREHSGAARVGPTQS